MATRTFLKQNAGVYSEERTIEIASGTPANDVGKIPNIGPGGYIDPSLLNASATPAAGKVAVYDSSGKLDPSAMPTGIAADVATVVTSEALSAGDFVNLYNNSGVLTARKADASNGREAHGFVLQGAASGANASVYFEGSNTQVTGRSPGTRQYLSATTPGQATATPPSTAGQIIQYIGLALTATSITFEADLPVTLA